MHEIQHAWSDWEDVADCLLCLPKRRSTQLAAKDIAHHIEDHKHSNIMDHDPIKITAVLLDFSSGLHNDERKDDLKQLD